MNGYRSSNGRKKIFSITNRKGFQMTFAKGYTASVQFGAGNYSENRYWCKYGEDAPNSKTAEFAAWDESGAWVRFDGENEEVIGYLTADQVLARINEVAAM